MSVYHRAVYKLKNKLNIYTSRHLLYGKSGYSSFKYCFIPGLRRNVSSSIQPLLSFKLLSVTSTAISSNKHYASGSESALPVTTRRQKLKNAVKDYGSTVVVFHITISLLSLGGFYLAVSSGLDVTGIIKSWGIISDDKLSAVASGTSTFVVAYAVHKIFAPVRISITLASVPFIVKKLRKIGFLKTTKT